MTIVTSTPVFKSPSKRGEKRKIRASIRNIFNQSTLEPNYDKDGLSRVLMTPKSPPSEKEIMRIMAVCRNCCSDKKDCIGKFCVILPPPGSSPSRKPMQNFNQFRDIVNACQRAIATKTEKERATFLLNQIKDAATFPRQGPSGSNTSSPARKFQKRTTFAFSIPVDEFTDITVCKKAWYNIFGFTEYEFVQCANLLKTRSPLDALATITRDPTRRLTESTTANLTFDEMDSIFSSNLSPSDYGMYQ